MLEFKYLCVFGFLVCMRHPICYGCYYYSLTFTYPPIHIHTHTYIHTCTTYSFMKTYQWFVVSRAPAPWRQLVTPITVEARQLIRLRVEGRRIYVQEANGKLVKDNRFIYLFPEQWGCIWICLEWLKGLSLLSRFYANRKSTFTALIQAIQSLQ